jgi:tetratricopeptide (TPR) repeat protein
MQMDRGHTLKRLLVILALTLLPAGRLPAQQAPAATPTPAPDAPGAAVRRPPQARTQPEFKDYNTAYAVTGGAAMEKAANAFEEKYPSSELRSYLYAKAMHEYQTENNSDKMLAMGEKVLTLDPDNAVALVLTATVLSDNVNDTDADRAAKIAEIKRNAQRALDTVDVSVLPPSGANAEQLTAYKNTLRSMAYSALAITALKTGDNPGAEKEFRIAADLSQAQPDPFVWYHLALAQDHQGKYPEALVSINQALQYTGSNPDLGKLAAGERERLIQLTATPSGAPQPPASPSPPPQ